MAEDHPQAGVEYLTSTQVAKRLGMSQRSVHRWAEAGLVLPAWLTPGGHARYYWPDVQEQVRKLQRNREQN
jgi:DNA-binding transcriptional MerR regulator